MTRARRRVVAALVGLLWSAGASAADADFAGRDVDLRIFDARIVDGSGSAAIRGEVHVRGDRIVHVGPLNGAPPPTALRIVDAMGRVVAPGFVEPHAHGDPFATPDFENFLAQGVTTITLGQDGSSPAVADLGAWLEAADELALGPNVAMFVGHGTLRAQVAPELEGPLTGEALAEAEARLDAALDVAFGMSSGLEYHPGLYADDAELAALARVVGARGRLIMSHVRNEDDDALEASLAELIRQGEHARVHVAHLKSVYGRGEVRGREILALLAAARAQGVQISADVYPYTASYTGLSLLFPVWAKTRAQFDEAMPARRAELAEHLRRRVNGRNGPEATLLAAEPHTGMTLAELALLLEKPFEDVLIDDLGPDGGSAAYFIMDEALQQVFVADPAIAICSDGSPTGFHPRGHGAFARIIETFVQARGALSLEAAVRKMTSLPADILGLAERGRLVPGAYADLVLFDPAEVDERADYPSPLVLPTGFDLVVVNGVVVREREALTARRSGRVLRP